jgi:EAL domain-containing protein (putative c-di-GMP-specific phosphodiesterase class I)
MTSMDVREGQASEPPAGQPRAHEDLLRHASVLIVDDAPANVALLTRLLRSADVRQLHGVTDSREAVEVWLQVRPDLVLLDLQMPHLDGFEVMAALRAAAPDGQFVPILVLTADTTPTTRDRALSAGANDFLTKPFDRTEVVLRVRNLLQTGSLYAAVQRHNATLTAELERHADQERRLAAEHRELTAAIDTVLTGGRLSMVFQPIVDLARSRLVGLEALARFAGDPPRPPNEWFEDAGRVDRSVDLEIAAIAAALQELDQLPAEVFLSVNASPATAMSPQLERLLDRFTGQRIVLELTEHSPVDDYDALLAALGELRRRGIRIAVDDTGAGYAGLQHLLRVRPEVVKLDVALTRGIDVDPARRALATGLVAFAREMGSAIIAEGIETAAELETLRGLEIGWGQGYHLARPSQLPSALSLNAFATAAGSA